MNEKDSEVHENSDKESENKDSVKSVQLSPLKPVPNLEEGMHRNIDMLMDVHIPVLVELGKAEMVISDILKLNPGSIIELDSLAGEPVKITVRGKTIALGEVVVVDENFGVKISKISNQQDRIQSMG
ncbi:MAG: flagellar motor switch protein FliN [Candidatus Scalindua sp.]|nr:flagellar motor switch protein FliN [Candidatus Scalindua sp.]